MVYLQASIKLKPGKLQDFVAMLNELAPVLAKRGMKLLGSYGNVVGRLNTVVDFWELPDGERTPGRVVRSRAAESGAAHQRHHRG